MGTAWSSSTREKKGPLIGGLCHPFCFWTKNRKNVHGFLLSEKELQPLLEAFPKKTTRCALCWMAHRLYSPRSSPHYRSPQNSKSTFPHALLVMVLMWDVATPIAAFSHCHQNPSLLIQQK